MRKNEGSWMQLSSLAKNGIGITSIVLCFYIVYSTTIVYQLYGLLSYPFLKINQYTTERINSFIYQTHAIDGMQLKRENQLLHMQNIRLRAALTHLNNTKELAVFNKRYHDQSIIVQILGRHIGSDSHYFLVDAGSDQGIEKEMPVIYKNKLVGKVSEVYSWYSKVTLITDHHCKISAYCFQTNAKGVHQGTNNPVETSLQFVDHLTPIKKGDLVLSNGQGLIFPAGFALGNVLSWKVDGLYKRIAIKPACNIQEISYCTILLRTHENKAK